MIIYSLYSLESLAYRESICFILESDRKFIHPYFVKVLMPPNQMRLGVFVPRLYRSVNDWGCDYSPHRRAFVKLPLQEIREHIMTKWESYSQ